MSFLDYMTAARRGYAQLKHRFSRRPVAAGARGVNLALLMADRLAQKEKAVTLPYLTPQRAVQLFEHYRRGEFAPVMLEWEQMELYDDTLFPARNKRLAALKRMKWLVEADADAVGDDPALAELAEQQRVAALKALSKVENLDSILPEFGEADFNGIAAVERTGSLEVREVWRVIDPWHLYQPFRNGEVYYNAEADDVPQRVEELEPEAVLIRRAPAANVPVMFLILRKHLTDEQWDAFIATYGLPNIFFELPPAMDERRAAELDAVVQQLASDGRGTLPNGTKVQTVETQQRDGTLFQQRVKECRDSIITIILGGTLTMETESGSGTLAGNAHADSFAELCEGSAHDIGAVVDEQFVRPLLRKLFPGQPILVHFDYRPQDAADAAAAAQTLATLKTAGWQVSAETASEMLGFEVEAAPAAESTMYNGQSPRGLGGGLDNTAGVAPQGRAADGAAASQSTNPMFGAAAPREFVGNRAEGAGNSTLPTSNLQLPTSEAEPPLTQDELDALALVQNAMDPDVLRKKAAAIAGTLYGAMQTGKRGETVANQCNQHEHDPGCEHGDGASEQKEDGKEEAQSDPSPQVLAQRTDFRAKADAAKKTGLAATGFADSIGVHPRFRKEVCSPKRIKESQSALSRAGIKDKDEQTRIHYEIAARFAELIQSSVPPVEEGPKKQKQKRDKAWHYRVPCEVPGATRPIIADFTVMKFKKRKGPELYSFFLRTGKAPSQENSPK